MATLIFVNTILSLCFAPALMEGREVGYARAFAEMFAFLAIGFTALSAVILVII